MSKKKKKHNHAKKSSKSKAKQKQREVTKPLVIIDLDDEANKSFLEDESVEENADVAETIVETASEGKAEETENGAEKEESVETQDEAASEEKAEETGAGAEKEESVETQDEAASEEKAEETEAGAEKEESVETQNEVASEEKAEETEAGAEKEESIETQDEAVSEEKQEEPVTGEKTAGLKLLLEKLHTVNKEKLMKSVLLCVAAVVIAFWGYWLFENGQVYKVCSVEAGVEVSATDFLKNENAKAFFTEDSDDVDITLPGEYQLFLKKGMFTHKCTLKIKDTIAPQIEVQEVRIDFGKQCEAKDFVVSIQDATKTEISFVKEPDYTLEKPQTVEIAVTDAGGNVTQQEVQLIISHVVTVLDWEIGQEKPAISDFVIVGEGGKILTDLEEVDYNKLGSYDVQIELNKEVYDVKMNIVDTTAPVIEVQDVDGHIVCERKAEEFIASAEDLTQLTYTFETQPDTDKLGVQNVTVIATDEGGNQVSKQARLTLTEDTQDPVIKGAEDLFIFIGEKKSFIANVTVEDGCPHAHELKVDSGKVNRNAAGTYPITYTATDCAGHSTSVTVNVTVKETVYDINEVNALADKVLAKIITDDMSVYDKAKAIFNYTKTSIGYISHSEKGNYIRSAYEGLVDKRGDCYVYASTAKVLLDRAGVPNMDIERIPEGTTMHWWNLVDVGDGNGWYHFDTTPRVDRPVIFLWNDQKMKEYSDSHKNSHNYDRSKYPVIN